MTQQSVQLNTSPTMPNATMEQRLAAWVELMGFGDQMYRAGLQLRLRPGEDVESAMRQSYARFTEEHDRTLIRLMERFEATSGR